MLTITKRFEFDAAHQLPFHQGKCKNLHGHRYVLEVTLKGKITPELPWNGVQSTNPSAGMIMDFGILKKIVKNLVIDIYDHQYLNVYFENPTAEKMVVAIAFELRQAIKKNENTNAILWKVRLYETPGSWAEWIAE